MHHFKRAILLPCLALACCQQIPKQPATTSIATTTAANAELRDLLAGMARSHDDKTQLAFYEALPWNNTGEPFHAFYTEMGKKHAELLKELQAYAKGAGIDLKFSYSNDTAGRAQKIMEARQEKLVRGDTKADFGRDTLMQMYTDYEWQISLIQALLPTVTDPALKAYLQKSLKVHEDGSNQLNGLLKKFQPVR